MVSARRKYPQRERERPRTSRIRSWSGDSVGRCDGLALVLPPSGLSPYAIAIASMTVDFPTPFSPTRTVSSESSSPSRSSWLTGPIVNGHAWSSAPGSAITSRTGSELKAVTRSG